MGTAAQMTPGQLQRMLSDAQPGIPLYRASDDWWVVKYLGDRFWFPPDLGGKMVPAPQHHEEAGKLFKADGVLMGRDRRGMTYTPNDTVGTPMVPAGIGVRPGMYAAEIVTWILGHHTNLGVVMLDQNPENQGPQKAASRQVVYASKKTWAETERSTRQKDIDRFRSSPGYRAGDPLPAPTATQIRAQEWLDANAFAASGMFNFACECGHWSGNDYSQYRLHSKAAHARDLAETPQAEGVDLAKPETRAKVDADAQALNALMQEAEEKLAAERKTLDDRAAELDRREAELKGKKKGAEKGD